MPFVIANDNPGVKQKYWITYIKNRKAKKKNFLGVLTGPCGVGKSYTGISICQQVDPTFCAERIIFSLEELMELINGGKLKTGDAILWDEAGVGISNREWQGVMNKTVNFLLQTFRSRQLIVIFTAPYMDFLDNLTKKLFNAEFIVMNIDYTTKEARIKPQFLQYSSRYHKFYYKYLRVKTKRGLLPCEIWRVAQPDEAILTQYEAKKVIFTNSLNKDIMDSVKFNKKVSQKQKPLTLIQEKALMLMKQYSDVEKVAQALGIGLRTVYFHLSQAEKKGYNIENRPTGDKNA